MSIEKLNIQEKADNPNKKALLARLGVPQDESLSAQETNKLVGKTNELVEKTNELNQKFDAYKPVESPNYKQTVPTYADLLLLTDVQKDDMYQVEADGRAYIYNGTSFQPSGKGFLFGINPPVESKVEEGNDLAVSGDRVFSDLKKVGFRTLERNQNILDELVGSNKNNTELWTPGYFWQDGSIRNDSSNEWYCAVKYYPITLGLFNVHLTIGGNACLIYYDKLKNPVGFLKNETAPTAYTFDVNVDLKDAVYFKPCHNFTAEPTTDLLYIKPSQNYNMISEDVFEFAGKTKESDKYVTFLNQSKLDVNTSLMPIDFYSSDFEKYLEQGYISNSGEITLSTWNATNGVGWSHNSKYPILLPKGGVYDVTSTMSGNAFCSVLNDKFQIIELISTASNGVVINGDLAKFKIDLSSADENRYLVMSLRDYDPVNFSNQHITVINKVKLVNQNEVFFKELKDTRDLIEKKEIKHSLDNNVDLPNNLEMFDFQGNKISEVGLSNTIYKLPIPTKSTELRIKFDVQFNEDINVLGADSAKIFAILKHYNRSFRTRIVPKNTTIATDSWGSGYANTNTQCIRSNSQFDLHYSGGTFTAQTFTPSKRDTFGKFLFGIQYNEDVESNTDNRDVCLSITNSLFRIYKKSSNTTLYSKTITSETLVSEIVNELKLLSYLGVHVKSIQGYKATELIKIEEINLSSTSRWVNGTEYWDSGICWIAKAISDKWHTIEIVFTQGKIYYAFNGETYEVTSTINFLSPNTIMYFGGELGVSNNLQNTIRNIHVNMNYLGDAEIVNYSLNYPLQTPKVYSPKVVSDYNPLIYIGVGHPVFDTTENEILADSTGVSTDRLAKLFEKFNSLGYVNVTPSQIADWKKGLIKLPKRCFTVIFDDYRYEIYANPKIRAVFEQYNVKGSLALITERVHNGYADQPKYGDYNYDPKQFFQKMNLEGWDVHSHTRDHDATTGYLRFRKTSEMYNELLLDVADSVMSNVNTNTLTYPQGQTRTTAMYAIANTPFKLGLMTANGNNLPCHNNNDYYVYRFELGQRNPLQNLLESIV